MDDDKKEVTIKTSRDKGIAVGVVCLFILIIPWALLGFGLVIFAEGTTTWDWLSFVIGVLVITCVSALLGLSVSRRSRVLLGISLFLVLALLGGLAYIFYPLFTQP